MHLAITRAGLQSRLRTPAGRGFALAAAATACTGFAMSAQQNIVSNFFEHDLGLSGSEFGYITAIREIPGFLLIFITALCYRIPLQKVTAGALLLLAVGYGFFGGATSFWAAVPWVVLSSLGGHTWLQTQPALGMTLTTEERAGSVLGRLSSFSQIGALLAMLVTLSAFGTGLLDFGSTFMLCGVAGVAAAVAIFGFPNLQNGKLAAHQPERPPMVLRFSYRYYYLLCFLDGARMQIFFSFGLWVLVDRYKMDVPSISLVLMTVTALGVIGAPWVGRMFDRYGERRVLAFVNVAYVVSLLGYGLVDNLAVVVLCYVIYSFISPFSWMGSATYLRKVAPARDLAPSLAMGLTVQHASSVLVPTVTGFILTFAGYQIPFVIACGFACLTFGVTRRLRPEAQKSKERMQEEEAARVSKLAAAVARA